MYNSTKDTKILKKSRQLLKSLYDIIPDTKGCLEHIKTTEEEGGCGCWCCHTQMPQVLYSEFLNTWCYIINNWEDSKILSLIERCVRTYVFTFNKGCVFVNENNNLCEIHKHRPYNCILYGIIPEEEFKPRYEQLKVIYPETRQQCKLVSTLNGKEVTIKDTEKWWNTLKSIEMKIGIDKKDIHDGDGGSYRRYHEHILIHMFGEDSMSMLSELRKNKDVMMKENAIRHIIKNITKTLNRLEHEKRNS